MNYVAVFLLAATALAASARAQDATPKPARRWIPFLGRSATPVPATPEPKATPAKVAKSTPKPVSRPAEKAVEKPPRAEKVADKPVAKPAPVEKPAEQVAEKPPEPAPAEKVAAKPAEKPAVAEPIIEKPAATTIAKPEAKPIETVVIVKSPAKATPLPAPPSAERVAARAVDKAESPAVVTSTVPPEPAQIVRKFFGLLGNSDIDGAYASLMKGSRIGERPEDVRGLKAKTKEAISLFGAMHGYDLVDSKPVGERLMRATYLSLGHELPLRWRFYFYKSEKEWKLIDLRVDDKLTGIFDEVPDDAVRTSDLR